MKICFILFTFLFCAASLTAQNKLVTKNIKGTVDLRSFAKDPFDVIKDCTYSQDDMEKLDTVVLRVQYVATYREEERGPFRKSVEALYIGNEKSEYRENLFQYSEEHMPEILRDAHPTTMDSLKRMMNVRSKIEGQFKPTLYTIQKNHPQAGWLRCYNNLMVEDFNVLRPRLNPRLFYDEPIPTLVWELNEGDTIVCGYSCQRASTTFRGRTWKVWYAPDLPFQDGPWKLCGLPGLILKAEDAEGDFKFEATELRHPQNEFIVEHPTYKKYSKATFKRMREIEKMRSENPEALVKLIADNGIFERFEQYGSPIRIPRPVVPCLLEKFE